MLKQTLLIGAMIIATPVAAQTATNPTPGIASAPQTVPITPVAPGDAVANPATTAASTSPVAQTATQPATTGAEVAAVVDKEFPGYDTDKDGTLSAAEFGAWMVALKTKSDPTTKAGTPETTRWVDAAFAQADTDKSKSLTKTELTGFLSQGRS